MTNIDQTKLIGPFKQLVTMRNLPLKGALKDDQLEVIDNGGLLVKGEQIVAVGRFDDLKENAELIEEIEGDCVALPGFIDAHTHICFGGGRAKDYAMRNSGKTYLEIAKEGGGIWDTVTKTREASEDDLIRLTIERAKSLLERGITTIEVKSGYGLSVKEELKMLRAIKSAKDQTVSDLVSTCLAAHILPKDFKGSHEDYLNYIATYLLPKVIAENLASRVDIFIEEEAFEDKIALDYLNKASMLGFTVTVHADQFSVGGSQIAIAANAVSADHLEASTHKEIKALANSNVIPIALPGASLGLGCAFTPARQLLDAGTSLVIASDWNPGSAPMGNLLVQASILATYQKLSNAEVLSGITFRAAKALSLTDRGILDTNYLADFVAFPCKHYNEILYHQGQLKPNHVWKRGRYYKLS